MYKVNHNSCTVEVTLTTRKPEVELNIALYPVEILADTKDKNNGETGLFCIYYFSS